MAMPELNFRRVALPVAPEKIGESVALLQQALRQYRRVTYASSLGVEASVLIDLIFQHAPQIDIFTVDTGRLPEPTLELLERITKHYGRSIRLVFPEAPAVQNFVASHGINGFYRGLEQRLGCCEIRKLEPFRRAIAGYNGWVTGVRHEQSAARAGTKPIEWDERYRLHKIPTTRCMIRVTRALAVRPARAPLHAAKTAAPGAGGGKARSRANADCNPENCRNR
jgi:phosphoadenosine phosphosulfate reductase